MQDVGRLVEDAPESVAAEIAHHRETFLLDERLDRVADIAGGGAGPHHLDAPHHRLEGDVADATGLRADDNVQEQPAGVAMPPENGRAWCRGSVFPAG